MFVEQLRTAFFISYKSAMPYVVVGIIAFQSINCSKAYAQDNHIIGLTTEQVIREQFPIFDIYAERYQPDSVSIAYLKQLSDSIEIITVFGTWCKDSKKNVPSLFKILHLAKNSFIGSRYYGIGFQDSNKIEGTIPYKIKVNPTFLVLKSNIEIGRIEEQPHNRLEQDLVNILQNSPELRY